ncbi:MAG: hypothetical protein WDO69_00905 [Pseudomonadota bacterium]
MPIALKIVASTLGLLSLTGCGKEPEQAPPAAPTVAPAVPASAPPVAQAPAASATPPPAPVAKEYPMCGGQHLAQPATVGRSGVASVQLAPAFLDEMTACRPESAVPKDVIARATDGTIDAKGDCVFASVGVSCHYHSGSEFVTMGTKAQTAGQGELHCIFPSDEPSSPHVFGAHLTCSDPARGKPAEHESHTAKTGASCSVALLQQLEHCTSSLCCDDGTLTNQISDLVRDGKNDIRPDFRICQEALPVDCSLLENMSPHPANSPALGGIGKPVFGAGAVKKEGAAKASSEKSKASGTPK